MPTRREREALHRYFEFESDFMPKKDFYTNHANIIIRKFAVSTIATNWRNTDMDAFIPYLAMNYFDRFVSRNPFLDAEIRLVVICCLTIAAKMRTKSFCLTSFLEDRSIAFTRDTIRKMELHILDSLGWRMRPITPFSFLDYFYPTFGRIGGFKRRSINEIIVQALGDDDFIEYKPSQIAQSSFLAATNIAYPLKFPSTHKPEELTNCYQAMIELCQNKDIKIEKRRQTIVTEIEEEEDDDETNKVAPKRLMNFDLKWPKNENHTTCLTTRLREVVLPWEHRCMIG
ncbi:PREDICTED: putative cyclin-D6-1 [Lupinus angustifolius]|uniref:putative cyclin-D6-1 n=1 Tax=Lupinus angustifolius TaxID=3871 RepID=UPI00092ECE65|nr:PREDICTED: putative cyclin-D6-1 [Lupinus angustifolius]